MRFRRGLAAALLIAACSREEPPDDPARPSWEAARCDMVTEQIEGRGIRDEAVLRAMRAVPRHEFVPDGQRAASYTDRPLRIGEGQTISQPYIVAVMAQLAKLGPGSKVLEIGTGSGYGAAVLSEVAGEVYTVEIIESLASRAEGTLKRLGYKNVRVLHRDGYRGWPEEAPFDAIVVTAAPVRVPEPLKNQLKVGGRLVLPVGNRHQEMRVITRTKEGFSELPIMKVQFVPMTGEVRDPR